VLPLLVIVRLTLLDALRRRILWVLFFLTVIVVGLSALGFERLVSLARAHGSDELSIQLGVSQMLIVVAFMFSFILAMTAAFIGAPAVAADIACAAVDRASRDVIADAGWAEAFSHSTGHGVGLEIHEAPRVASTAGDTLLLNDVVTVEPGVYLPGIGGVRIEDTLVVGATGAEALTLTPKDLVL